MEGLLDLVMSPEAFLEWADRVEDRAELVDGHVVMHAGATRAHERVAKRVFASLHRQVDEAEFDVNKGDFGVKIRGGNAKPSVLYPDVLVDVQAEDGSGRETETPIVVVEVLSESTNLAHHVRKLAKYADLESLSSYLVFEQEEPLVRMWTKSGTGWDGAPVEFRGMAAVIELPEVGATIALAEVYGDGHKPRVAATLG